MRWRCTACSKFLAPLEFEGDPQELGVGECPKCGSNSPQVVAGPLVDVHLVVMDRAGPILGGSGRQYVACQKKRDHLAAHAFDTYSATDDPRAVTCRSCKGTQVYKELAALFPEIAQNEAIQRRMRADCCG